MTSSIHHRTVAQQGSLRTEPSFLTQSSSDTLKKRSLWERLLGAPTTSTTILPEQSEPTTKREEIELHDERKPDVLVTKPARSPLEAFKDAINDGTRLFCEKYVHPLYVEDQQTKFRVTGIKMYVPKDASELTFILEELPIDVRNRLARLRAQNAPGAADQLVFDENFFGITIDVQPAIIAGQHVRLLASWTGNSIEITMAFSGKYITVKPAPPLVQTVDEPQKPMAPEPVFVAPTQAIVEPVNADAFKEFPTIEPAVIVPGAKQAGEPPSRRISADTPLGLPVRPQRGKDTFMPEPEQRLIAQIRILPYGAQQETLVRVCADMLPFMLGREHTSTGRFEHGYSIFSDTDPNLALLVSREHLELQQFDKDESRFHIVNHSVARNGTYHNGCAVPERFIFKAVSPQNTLILGGSDGQGTVRIVIEAV